MIRLGAGHNGDTGENDFSAFNAVQHPTLQVEYLCDYQLQVSWAIQCNENNQSTIAPEFYTLYGGAGMNVYGTTTDNTMIVDFSPNSSEMWFSVSASYDDDGTIIETERCNAKRYILPTEIISCDGGNLIADEHHRLDHNNNLQKNQYANEENSIRIYPNPVTDMAVIEFFNPIKKSQTHTVHLMDIMGKTIQSFNMNVENGYAKTILPTDRLQSGMYLIKVNDDMGNVIHSEKLIKQ